MCAAGVEGTAQESMAAAALAYLVSGPRVATPADDCHPLALPGIPADGPLELTRVALQQSSDDRHVGAAVRAVLELRRKRSVARVVTRDDDQARRSLVAPRAHAGGP